MALKGETALEDGVQGEAKRPEVMTVTSSESPGDSQNSQGEKEQRVEVGHAPHPEAGLGHHPAV
jgi:hypothetical protein